jgi:ABC-type branched-subunit amino acid transport system substrate-binding protein
MAHPILDPRSGAGRYGVSRARVAGAAAAAGSLLLLTACGGAVAESSGGSSGGSSDDPFTIGLIAPVTGPVVAEGTAMQRGFDLAVAKINAEGGVLGRPLEVVTVDDEANVTKSTQLAQRLINQDQVDFLFGTIPGDTAGAVAQVSDEAQVPFATAIMGDPPYCGDYFFPFGEPDQTMLEGIVPRMLAEHGKEVALVGSDYVFPRSFNAKARAMVEAAGGTVVLEEYSPLGTTDWQPVVGKISGAAPDWIMSAVVGGDAVGLVTQADQAGLLADTGLTGISLIQDYYPSLTTRTEGMVLSGRYSDQLEGAANEEFVSAFREAYDVPDPIPSVAANAYEGVQAIARAVEKAGSTDGKAVSEALAKETVQDGVFGNGSFTEDHFFVTDMNIFQIEPGGAYQPIEELPALDDLQQNSAC